MSAYEEQFPWTTSYPKFDFYERKMANHNRVVDFIKEQKNIHIVRNKYQGETRDIRTFICDCYSYGVAEFHETMEKTEGTINAIIINSNWCGYTHECKKICRESGVGLFKIKQFMAAINMKRYWLYLDEDEKEHFQEKGWI